MQYFLVFILTWPDTLLSVWGCFVNTSPELLVLKEPWIIRLKRYKLPGTELMYCLCSAVRQSLHSHTKAQVACIVLCSIQSFSLAVPVLLLIADATLWALSLILTDWQSKLLFPSVLINSFKVLSNQHLFYLEQLKYILPLWICKSYVFFSINLSHFYNLYIYIYM